LNERFLGTKIRAIMIGSNDQLLPPPVSDAFDSVTALFPDSLTLSGHSIRSTISSIDLFPQIGTHRGRFAMHENRVGLCGVGRWQLEGAIRQPVMCDLVAQWLQ
jgi:hypothetical protein